MFTVSLVHIQAQVTQSNSELKNRVCTLLDSSNFKIAVLEITNVSDCAKCQLFSNRYRQLLRNNNLGSVVCFVNIAQVERRKELKLYHETFGKSYDFYVHGNASEWYKLCGSEDKKLILVNRIGEITDSVTFEEYINTKDLLRQLERKILKSLHGCESK
jgi:hypothetical protein